MRVSLALKQDAKVQKRYLQAQINEVSDKMVEVAGKFGEQDRMNEEFDKFMRQFQDTLNQFDGRLTAMKFDETGFNERCSKIFSMFDDSKQQNLRIVS